MVASKKNIRKILMGALVFFLMIFAGASNLNSTTVLAGENGQMTMYIGGGFTVGPDGYAEVFGNMYELPVDGSPVENAMTDYPMEGVKVDIFEGNLYAAEEYESSTPIATGYTNANGRFAIKVPGAEGESLDYSLRATKDGEITVYCGNGSGTYVIEWPTINIDAKDIEIKKDSAFDYDMILNEDVSYSIWRRTLTENFISGVWQTNFVVDYSGDVDTSIPGEYPITIDALVQVRDLTKGELLDSRIATQTVTVTVVADSVDPVDPIDPIETIDPEVPKEPLNPVNPEESQVGTVSENKVDAQKQLPKTGGGLLLLGGLIASGAGAILLFRNKRK